MMAIAFKLPGWLVSMLEGLGNMGMTDMEQRCRVLQMVFQVHKHNLTQLHKD